MHITFLDRFEARPGRILQWTPSEISTGTTYPVPPTSNQQLHLAGSRGDTTWLAATFDVPGPIDTEATRTVTPGNIVKDMVKRIPLQRMGTPEDLVGMCLFLLSDDAGWVTGQIFNVDGGQVYRS